MKAPLLHPLALVLKSKIKINRWKKHSNVSILWTGNGGTDRMQFSQVNQGEKPGHRKEMKKHPAMVLCPKVIPCHRGRANRAAAAQGLLLLCVFSGKLCILKANDSETKEGSTMGRRLDSLGHGK